MQKSKPVMKSTKPAKIYLTLQAVRGSNGRVNSVRLAHADEVKPVNLKEDQTCFAIKLNVPVSTFDVPVYEMTVDFMIPEEIKAEVESWINGES
jgi:hypothetical protein